MNEKASLLALSDDADKDHQEVISENKRQRVEKMEYGSVESVYISGIKGEVEKKRDDSLLLNRLFFGWVDRFVSYGSTKTLNEMDLPNLSKSNELNSRAISNRYESALKSLGLSRRMEDNSQLSSNDYHHSNDVNQHKRVKRDPTSPLGVKIFGSIYENEFKIVRAMHRVFGIDFYFACVPKVIADVLATIVTPLLIYLILLMISLEMDYSVATRILMGGAYCILLFFSKVLQTIAENYHFHQISICVHKARVCLTSAIYKKILKLNVQSRKICTTGDVINLVANHSERLKNSMFRLHNLWSAPFRFILGIAFLYYQLGWLSFLCLLVPVLMTPISLLLHYHQQSIFVAYLSSKDKRSKMLQEMISAIKLIKFYVWERWFDAKIRNARSVETKQLMIHGIITSLIELILTSTPFIISFVAFMTYASLGGNSLSTATAFSVLAVLGSMVAPLSSLPTAIINVLEVKISLKKIYDFLALDEKKELPSRASSENIVEFKGATFSFDQLSKSPQLENISVEIKRGEFVVIVGEVGSGKSCMLQAMLGEMNILSGEAFLNDATIAYVPQVPWVLNASFKENITFCNPDTKSTHYKNILNACDLIQDISQLPDGDCTEIGERGINLSGGQKARLNLARALYEDADLYLLDDVLSSVDIAVANHLIEKVFISSLRSKTVVLCTHNTNVLKYADRILVMKEGKIIEEGTFEHLTSKNESYFLKLFSNHLQIGETKIERKEQTALPNGGHSSENRDQRKRNKEKLIIKEKKNRGPINRSTIMHYISAYSQYIAVVIVIFNIARHLMDIGGDIWISNWAADPNFQYSTMTQYIFVYLIIGIGKSLLDFLFTISCAYYALQTATIYHENLVDRILHATIPFFERNSIGRIVSLFSKDITVLDVAMFRKVKDFIHCGAGLLMNLIILTMITPVLILVVIPLALIYYLLQKLYRSVNIQLGRMNSVTKSPIYSCLSETMEGYQLIRAFSREEEFLDTFISRTYNHIRLKYAQNMCIRWFSIRVECIGWTFVCCTTSISLVTYFIFTFLQFSFLTQYLGIIVHRSIFFAIHMSLFMNFLSETETLFSSVERVQNYLTIEQECYSGGLNNETGEENPEQIGSIEFRDVGLKYRVKDEPVLRGVTFKVQPNEKVGICGRTGAGKSSLFTCLLRIREISSGSIQLHGKDILTYTVDKLRSLINVVPQDPLLLSGTLRTNLDPWDQFEDSKIWKALESVHMKQRVQHIFSNGLDSEISEQGMNLSVGERQLICLGRALLHKTKVLILDEATANMDPLFDEYIQSTIQQYFTDCTVLCIAHRLSSLKNYHRILWIDEGNVKRYDHPSKVLEELQTCKSI